MYILIKRYSSYLTVHLEEYRTSIVLVNRPTLDVPYSFTAVLIFNFGEEL